MERLILVTMIYIYLRHQAGGRLRMEQQILATQAGIGLRYMETGILMGEHLYFRREYQKIEKHHIITQGMRWNLNKNLGYYYIAE